MCMWTSAKNTRRKAILDEVFLAVTNALYKQRVVLSAALDTADRKYLLHFRPKFKFIHVLHVIQIYRFEE